MFSPEGHKRRDKIFLMHQREGSEKMLCGCANMCASFAASDMFHNSSAAFGENQHLTLCISSKSTSDSF